MKTINSYKKSFNVFAKLPLIMLIVSLVFAFVWGIVDTEIFGSSRYGHGTFRTYSGFLNWFLWQLILGAGSVIMFLLSKVAISPIILQTEYLRLIATKPSVGTKMGKVEPVKGTEILSINKNYSQQTNENTVKKSIFMSGVEAGQAQKEAEKLNTKL